MSLEKLEARDAGADLERLAHRLAVEFGHGGGVFNRDAFNGAVGRAWMMGARVALNVAGGREPCRICGCWELEACDGGCGWAEPGLCTACAEGR